MQISEARLKEIVLEEVRNRLVERQWQQFKTAMREELAKEGIYLTEEELEEMSIEDLDELVHDLKAEEASVINNAGREAQIEYILGEQ